MSAAHATILGTIVGAENETLASAALVVAAIGTLGFFATRRLSLARTALARSGVNGGLTVPDESLTANNFVELVTEFVLNLGDTVMGKENRKYLPFAVSIFVYLAACNLLGLLPGFSMPTDSVAFNLGIALTVFVLYNFWGIREVGAVNYLKHLLGPVWWLGPFFLVIELISHCVRPLTLSLRLFGNMLGDHVVLGVFTDLTRIGVPVIFYLMGTFVCLMQAFVFTLLTMVYIRFATTHEHDESHDDGESHGGHH